MKLMRKDGFTIIEILTTVTLMALLLTLIMPSLKQSYQQLQMDAAIQTLHKDIRWAQRLADQEQKRVMIQFHRDAQPYRYVVTVSGNKVSSKEVKLPDNLAKIEAKTIIISPDKTFQNNGHVLIQKGAIRRYVYYYQTGRSRVTAKAA